MKTFTFQISDGHRENGVIIDWPETFWHAGSFFGDNVSVNENESVVIKATTLEAALNKLRPMVKKVMRQSSGDYNGLTLRERAEEMHVAIVSLDTVDGEDHWVFKADVIDCPSR